MIRIFILVISWRISEINGSKPEEKTRGIIRMAKRCEKKSLVSQISESLHSWMAL